MSKTVLLIRNAAKDDFGGAETYQVSLALLLQEQSLHPIVVTRSRKLQAHAQEHAVEVVRGWWLSRQDWGGVRALLLPLYILWQLGLTAWYIQLIIKTKADVLHIQSRDDFIAGTIAAKIMHKRAIWELPTLSLPIR